MRLRKKGYNLYDYPEEYKPGTTAGPLPDDHRIFPTDYFIATKEAILCGPTWDLWFVLEFKVPQFKDHRSVYIYQKSKVTGTQQVYKWDYKGKRWLNILL